MVMEGEGRDGGEIRRKGIRKNIKVHPQKNEVFEGGKRKNRTRRLEEG